MNRFGKFALRWLVCSLGLWIAANLLGGDRINYQDSFRVMMTAGLVLALINTFIKPLIVFLSLPAVLLTLGIFMVVINGLTVMLAAHFYSRLEVADFVSAMLAGVVIGLVNFFVTGLIEEEKYE
ncbi:phage holin family protein [Candidatus Saccharibacteria bacterium]|jgi:putative membrane protein|nr:MAG: phage holin family protein [Candidatus Saccharibacteria bacterium]